MIKLFQSQSSLLLAIEVEIAESQAFGLGFCLLHQVYRRTSGSLHVRLLYLAPDTLAVPDPHQKYLPPVSFLLPTYTELFPCLPTLLHTFLKYY